MRFCGLPPVVLSSARSDVACSEGPMTYKTITVKPLSPNLGAEIQGVDLSKPLSNAQFDDIHTAFLKHHVIFFRDQQLTPEQHVAFGKRWGTLNIHPYVKGMEGYPEILEIIKEPSEKINFGGGWHSDMSFLEVPALRSEERRVGKECRSR